LQDSGVRHIAEERPWTNRLVELVVELTADIQRRERLRDSYQGDRNDNAEDD
jgi:hypothetical protein